jgi:hypothetical protein
MPTRKPKASRKFWPFAFYVPKLGDILYIGANVSYREDPVDRFLTILRHPYRQDIVGIKISDFAMLVGSDGTHPMNPRRPMELRRILKFALCTTHATVSKRELPKRLKRAYAAAENFVGRATISVRESRDALSTIRRDGTRQHLPTPAEIAEMFGRKRRPPVRLDSPRPPVPVPIRVRIARSCGDPLCAIVDFDPLNYARAPRKE